MTDPIVGIRAVLQRLRHLFSNQGWLTPPEYRDQRLSIFIREADAGSCGGCEAEIAMLESPRYNIERFGFHIVASPRHADVLLVTGPFTRSMETAVMAAFDAMPEPRAVITIGDGLGANSPFAGSYATIPLPRRLQDACIKHIPGDPPSPEQLLAGLLDAAEALKL